VAKPKIKPFDASRHLDNLEVIEAYLTEAFQSGDEKLILRAITNVARGQTPCASAAVNRPKIS
jgi:DNA-binding phage protein